jgi:hypothetical protein
MSIFGFGTKPDNLAERAYDGRLAVEEVNAATKEKLEEEKDEHGNNVLYCASCNCGIEVVEAILDKGVDVNGLSRVSIVIIMYVLFIMIQLTLFNLLN